MNSQKTINAPINLKFLLRRLQKDKAVLLIGPEVIMTNRPTKKALKESLQDYIQADLNGVLDAEDLKRIEYSSEDGFFFLEDNYRLQVVESVLEFYDSQSTTDLYRKIAELPFHLTISLSPDKLLGQAFEELNLPYHFHFYDKIHYNKTLDDEVLNFKPTKENRLIYNIFGSVEQEDSLILSYDDLFEFLQRVFGNYKLPKTVESTLKAANCFVFIGFNYSKWYLKLLLRLMNMHEKVRKIYGMDQPSTKSIETFFVNEFDMNFTHLTAVSFIEELHQKCKEENILISSNTVQGFGQKLPMKITQQTKNLIGSSSLKKAFSTLDTYCQQPKVLADFCQRFLLIKGRFQQVNKNNQQGILSPQEYTMTLNKIRKDLLELIQEFS